MVAESRRACASSQSQNRPLDLALRLAAESGSSADLVSELHRLHMHQWHLEDLTRSSGATDSQIASAKAEIDACNGHRHEIINKIDSLVMFQAVPGRIYSETVGELCDRLLILDLKQQALRKRGAWSTLAEAELLHAHLSLVVAELIADLAAGRATLPPRFGLKIYGAQREQGGAA